MTTPPGVSLYGPDGFGSTLDWARTIAQLAVDVEEMRGDELRGILAKVVATAPVAKGGLPLIDGYQTVGTDVVLLTAQASPVDNGPWLVGPSGWSRPTAFADGAKVAGGTVVVTGGDTNAGTVWTSGDATVGSTSQIWTSNPTPWLDVRRFGAVANGAAGSAKAGVLAAINAAIALPMGGTVYFPPGVWDVGDLAVLWPEFQVTDKQLRLQGAGKYQTTLVFSTDRGAGTYAVAGDYAHGALRSDQAGLYENTISDLTIQGPGARPAIMGVSPAAMNGVMVDTHVCLYRVRILGFRSAINLAGNHNKLTDCTLGNNLYSAYHSAVPGLGGDIVFDNCDLAGALLASHAIAPNAAATFDMWRGHNGFAPYAIYMETGRAAGSLALNSCTFVGTSFEYIGNGFIYSEDQNAQVNGCLWINCANFTSNNATYGLPASVLASQIRVHTFVNSEFRNTYLAGTPTVSWLDISNVISAVAFDYGHNLLINAKNTGVPFLLGPASANQAGVLLRDSNFRAEVAPAVAGVTASRLVEWDQFRRLQPHGQAGTGARLPIAGIAQNSVAGGAREYVIAVTEGNDITVDIDGAEATGSQVYVPSSTTPSKLMAVSWDGTIGTLTRPIVGALYLAGIGGGQSRARVKI